VTGKRYEQQGGGWIKRAYPQRCEQCGESWWAGVGTYRKSNGVCGACRKPTHPLGTRVTKPDGYVLVKVEDGWRREHRLVMEQALRRPLRDDNRIENLQLRQGNHGSGIAMCCVECGSQNLRPIPIDGGEVRAGSECAAPAPSAFSLPE
jgi:hypothetical protein